jgi:predicted RNase H-like HicB family nuclease
MATDFWRRFPISRCCMSDGETREAAARNIEDAIACWLEEAKAVGRDISEPKPVMHIA